MHRQLDHPGYFYIYINHHPEPRRCPNSPDTNANALPKHAFFAETRLLRIIGTHTIATARTLEQKISDAGPYGQRIDPHILTSVRNRLVREQKLLRHEHAGTPWFYLPTATKPTLDDRFNAQLNIHNRLVGPISARIGQALEIAVFRALSAIDDLDFSGRFKDLDAHDDSTLYAKEEPPQHIGTRSLPGDERLDFLIRLPTVGPLGVECKNVRSWLYPDREEVTDAIRKCIAINSVPVIIGRRIPYVTFALLSKCGVLFHQTYGQLLPESDRDLADQARDKTLLGYHDIQLGNQPDARLCTFIETNLPAIASQARQKFAENIDLLEPFSNSEMPYVEFAARVIRRYRGEDEDGELGGDPAEWVE
jgi:hypothetical protein